MVIKVKEDPNDNQNEDSVDLEEFIGEPEELVHDKETLELPLGIERQAIAAASKDILKLQNDINCWFELEKSIFTTATGSTKINYSSI